MRRTISFFIILFTSFCFTQNTGSILGVVLDSELNNEPLIHANVLIKETNQIASSDTHGMFHFENLEEGNYTLVISFIGYETKECSIQVAVNKQTDISASLNVSTISLNDLALLNMDAKQNNIASSDFNN